MRNILPILTLSTLALGPIACAANTDESIDPSADDPGSDEAEVKGKRLITQSDNGDTVDVPEGQAFAIKLSSNPSTGYKWVVQSVDRSLGYPVEKFVASSSKAIGSGGNQYFNWTTTSPIGSLVGTHQIQLGYVRSWETGVKPVKTFSVTVNIASKATKCGTHPACGTGTSCQWCWGSMACIPNGAMC